MVLRLHSHWPPDRANAWSLVESENAMANSAILLGVPIFRSLTDGRTGVRGYPRTPAGCHGLTAPRIVHDGGWELAGLDGTVIEPSGRHGLRAASPDVQAGLMPTEVRWLAGEYESLVFPGPGSRIERGR